MLAFTMPQSSYVQLKKTIFMIKTCFVNVKCKLKQIYFSQVSESCIPSHLPFSFFFNGWTTHFFALAQCYFCKDTELGL